MAISTRWSTTTPTSPARAARRSAHGGLPRRARGHGGAAASVWPSSWRRRCANANRDASCSSPRPHRCAALPTTRPMPARAAANGLVSSLAKELGRDGITVNAVGSNYVENPDYFPPALARQHGSDGQDDGADSARQARQARRAGRDDLFPLLGGRASSPVISCLTPADGRDDSERLSMRADNSSCHYDRTSKGRARRTEARPPGRNDETRRQAGAPPLGRTGPRVAHGTTDRPSPADLVPRPARGPLPVLLSAAGRAGRSGDDHRRPRRQGRDHRGHPPRARTRPADPRPVHRIHPARAARRSRPLDHLQQDGDRGAGA